MKNIILWSAFVVIPLSFAHAAAPSNTASRDEIIILALDFQEHTAKSETRQDAAAEEKKNTVHVNGYYKNLYTTSRTWDTGEGISGDLQRLRIDAKLDLSTRWMARAIFDQTLLLNDFARTSSFNAIKSKSQRKTQFINTEVLYDAKDHVYAASSLYRAYVKYDHDTWQMTAGKQSIDWGRTRFWSPLDLFNPVGPLEIERDERAGADALNFTFVLNPSSNMDFVYAPRNSFDKSSIGARLFSHIGNYDVFAVGGDFQGNKTTGAGFDGSIGGSGVRGEFTHTHSVDGRNFFRGVIGAEHALSAKLSVISEYFYNGGADADNPEFLTSYSVSSKVMSMRRNLFGLGLSYAVTPLLKWDNYAIYDIDGESAFYNPELRYSIHKDLDLTLGAQLLWGNSNASEFGNYENVYYAGSKYYF